MFAIGIILGLLTALLKAVDTVMNKSMMGSISPIDHSIYRILFSIPFLFVIALFHWDFKESAVLFLIIYSGIEIVNILFHQLAVKSLNPIHVEMLSKSKVFTTYLLSMILLVESFSFKGVGAVICFVCGMLMTIDIKAMNPKNFTGWKGYLYEIISVLARTIKPFMLKYMLNEGMLSNEVLALLSMVIAFLMMMVIFRPKLKINQKMMKNYFWLCFFIASSMITSGYAVLYAGAFLNSMLESFSVFAVIMLSFFLYRKRTEVKTWMGAILAVIGVCLGAL